MISIFLLLSLSYFFVFILIVYGWQKPSLKQEENHHKQVSVSIIIAARDEKETLPILISDLFSQTYPVSLYDVIVVDDHSSFRVQEIQELKKPEYAGLRILTLTPDKRGKKAALIEGARQSNATMLLFTDADCRVNREWISTMVKHFRNSGADMIIGLVDYINSGGFLNNFYRADLLSLVVSGAGAANIGMPVMCNGASMAVRRSVYPDSSSELRNDIKSGDDVFLLHALKKNKKKIRFIKDQNTIVRTKPPKNLAEFLNQRARWASKGTKYTDVATIVLAILVASTNILLLISTFLAATGNLEWKYYIPILALKIIPDFMILASAYAFFGKRRALVFYPVYFLIYPVYAGISVISGIFGLYTWKNNNT